MNGFPAISAFDAQPGRLSPHKDNIELRCKNGNGTVPKSYLSVRAGPEPLYSVYGFNGRGLA
jgi:hypothetical protein